MTAKTKEERISWFQILSNTGGIKHEYVPFSQGIHLSKYFEEDDLLGGLCKPLSLFWIGCNASRSDFWNWLTGRTISSRSIQVEASAVTEMLKWQKEYALVVSSNAQADEHHLDNRKNSACDKFFRIRGYNLKSQKKSDYKELNNDIESNIDDILNGRDVGADDGTNKRGLNSHQKVTGSIFSNFCLSTQGFNQLSYKMQIDGQHTYHAVAVRVGSTDVDFFDPNNGEFKFDSYNKFREWVVRYLLLTGLETSLVRLRSNWYEQKS